MNLFIWGYRQTYNEEVLQEKRAEYGKQIVVSMIRQLTEEYNGGWSGNN